MKEIVYSQRPLDPEIGRVTLKLIADTTGIPMSHMLGPSKANNVSRARQLAMKVMRECGMTFHAIGTALGRDHTSVIYGVRRVDEQILEGDTKLKRLVKLGVSVVKEEAANAA